MSKTFYQKNGFDVEVTIGNLLITTTNQKQDNGLCDDLIVNATANASRTAVFSFIPEETTVDIQNYQGKEVKIIIRSSETNGDWKQVFFGRVDSPQLDFLARKITLNCSDNRKNRIIQMDAGVVSNVGSYSSFVFGETLDKAEELEKRLETIAGDFDFDGYGNYQLTPWLPKSTADITFSSDDVSYHYNPRVDYNNRDKTINTIKIEVNYKYQRLHQQTVRFIWSGFTNFIQDWWNEGRPTFPARDSILSAASSGSWKVVSPNGVTLTPLWTAQYFQLGDGWINWAPDLVQEEYKGRTAFAGYLKDGDGEFVRVGDPAVLVPQYEPVLDENGKQIMDLVKRTITDTSSHLCRGASWTSALRFAQSVVEKYSITMKASQAIAQSGIIDSSQVISIDAPYDVNSWENSEKISFSEDPFYVNQKTNYPELNKAIGVMLNKARHNLLDLHRDVEVEFRSARNMRPDVDLKHTVSVTINQSAIGDSASIQAKGKVFSINHYCSFDTLESYTHVTLRLSRARGSATTDVWAVPIPTEDPAYIGERQNIALRTHLSKDPETTLNYDKLTGWICNRAETDTLGYLYKTAYPEQFVVDYPAISDHIRDEMTYNSASEFDLEIPNDFLSVSF